MPNNDEYSPRLSPAWLLVAWLLPLAALADEPPSASTVEDNIRALDADRDGLVTVSEIRAFLAARHGKDYEKALLDEMQDKADKSCGTPFSQSRY